MHSIRLPRFSFLPAIIGFLSVLHQPATGQGLRVTVDPRIELLGIVQSLGHYDHGYQPLTRLDFSYKSEAASYFSPFRDDPVVSLISGMTNMGFAFDAPPTVMLYCSDLPELRLRDSIPGSLAMRCGGREKLVEFIDALRNFARRSDFMRFYQSHSAWYDRIVRRALDSLRSDYTDTLETYYGVKQESYTIILAPLFTGGFGPRLEHSPGRYAVYNICGPADVVDSLPLFGDVAGFRHLAIHEFGHSFVNPVTAQFSDRVNQDAVLFGPIRNKMGGMAYGVWETCVNEHLVRAVTVRLEARGKGAAAGMNMMRKERGLGFVFVPAICRKLEFYEANRKAYPTFRDYYPVIAALFDSLASLGPGNELYDIPFEGPINSALSDRKSFIFILPTHEADSAAGDSVKAYVTRVRRAFSPDAPVLTDDEAIGKELSAYTVLVYGTVSGNRWLERNRSLLPAEIRVDRITADTVYSGNHLRFITAVRNPANRSKAIIIYTAQSAADVPGINALFHGPTDYVIGSGKNVLKAGDYLKDGGVWKFR